MPKLTSRLDALERSDGHELQRPFVIIIRTGTEPIGTGAPHPSRLDMLRQPGETWEALVARSTVQFQGLGPTVVYIPANGRE